MGIDESQKDAKLKIYFEAERGRVEERSEGELFLAGARKKTSALLYLHK